MTVEVQVKKQKAKDSMMLKMETGVYMLHYKNWIEKYRHWKTNRSRLYTLILLYCTSGPEELPSVGCFEICLDLLCTLVV